MSGAGLVLAAALLPASGLSDGFYSQLDWSGGGGDLGPDISFGTTFYTSENISWDGLPGYILLGIDATQHPINNDMHGCDYAFPADMDGDGDLDVVASQTLDWHRVMWFENDGSGGGWAEHEIEFNYPGVRCAYPGDLDNDGDMDVIGAGYSGVEWWRNEDGVGDTWQRFSIDDDFGAPFFACCADIDGDSLLEVVSTSRTSPDETAWWEPVTTPPDSVWQKRMVSGGSSNGYELYPVDLDQDGDMDILVAHYSADGLVFYENTDGSGTSWTAHEIIASWGAARSVHAADIDGDGDLDIVSCGADDDNNYLWLFENEGDSLWVEHVIDIGTADDWLPFGVHAADMTDDGLVDILCAVPIWNVHELALHRNITGSVDMFAKFVIAGGLSWFRDVDVADFDGDGKLDVLAAVPTGGINIRWFDIDPYLQGSLTSTILDAQGWPEWESIEWTSVEPEGTDITFQIRGSNDPDEMGAWSDTLSEPCSLEGHLDSAYRFIQYRVHLQAEPGAPTPYLEQVLIHFSSMGVEEGEGGEPLALSATPNPFTERALISVAGSSEETSVRVYDLSGRVIGTLSPDERGAFEWDGLDGSGAEVPAGCYVVRASGEGTAAQLRLIKL